MKSINATFEDKEFEALKKVKNKLKLTWHDFIMMLLGAELLKTIEDIGIEEAKRRGLIT